MLLARDTLRPQESSAIRHSSSEVLVLACRQITSVHLPPGRTRGRIPAIDCVIRGMYSVSGVLVSLDAMRHSIPCCSSLPPARPGRVSSSASTLWGRTSPGILWIRVDAGGENCSRSAFGHQACGKSASSSHARRTTHEESRATVAKVCVERNFCDTKMFRLISLNSFLVDRACGSGALREVGIAFDLESAFGERANFSFGAAKLRDREPSFSPRLTEIQGTIRTCIFG